jgi:hypothetical protein
MEEAVHANLEFVEVQNTSQHAVLESPADHVAINGDYLTKSLPPIITHSNHVNNQPVDGEWVGGIYVTSSRPGYLIFLFVSLLF